MNKNDRLFVKMVLSIIGILIIGYILTVSIRMNRVKQPEGAYMRLQDALLLTEAVNNECKEDARYIELQKSLKADRESLLTYRQWEELFEIMKAQNEQQGNGQNKQQIEEQRGRQLAEADIYSETLSELQKEYRKKYKEEFYMLQADWYRLYDELLAALGMAETVCPINVTVLGIGGEVTDKEGNTLAEQELLAEEGIFTYGSDLFKQNKYQVVKAYRKGTCLLTVREVVSRGMNLSNVWLMEAEKEGLQVFYKDYEIRIPYEQADSTKREQVADLDFADGRLQSVAVKSEKISGKLLSIRDGQVELEGSGRYPCAEDMKVYKLYGVLSEGDKGDLRIGYDFADFVLEDGVICAGLLTRDEAMDNIRVVIKNTDFTGAYHEKVEVTADTDFTIRYGGSGDNEKKEEKFQAGDVVTIDGESEYFTGERVYIEPDALTGRIRLNTVRRAQGVPEYRGKMELTKTPEGLVVVNELLLEEYLYSVVPSEMPASYPLEALKAQAICARTYAYRHMSRSGIAGLGAHVDDSAGYQVYNNIKENAQTTKAVKETAGELLYYGDNLCGSYYYSTSCGFGTDTNIWKSDSKEDTSYLQARRIGETAADAGSTGDTSADKGVEAEYTGESMTEEDIFEKFISQMHPSDYESEEAWYRWSYEVEKADAAHMLEQLKKRYAANERLILTKNKAGEYESKPIEKLGDIKDIYIEKRNSGGAADELIIEGTKNTYKVISEHNIRYVLNNGESKVVRQDGSEVASPTLLPSAYLTITVGKEDDVVVGYKIIGGGYGHGVGMSQNGAREMAKKGFSSEDILTFFYQSCEVRKYVE